jgi:DUF4097 and DUF4098 domain-containing protein YvlB
MYGPPPRQRSVAGPLILIGIGLLFLLRNFGYRIPLFHNFARYWPLLLVMIGLVRLAEYFSARRTQRPMPRMGGGTMVLLVFVILAGLSISHAYRQTGFNWGSLRDNADVDDKWMRMFGTEYTYDGEVTQALPAGGALRVNCDHGNITVNTWDQPQVRVVYHKRIFASSRGSADSTNQSTMPRVQLQGTTVEVQGNTEAAGAKGVSSNLEIFVPQKANVDLTATRGDVSVSQRTGEVRVNSQRGDVTLDQVEGDVNVTAQHGSLHASNVAGNLAVSGRLDDLSLDTISGTVLVAADIFVDTRLSKLDKGATIRTSRTNLQLARLDGDLTMDTGDLQGNGVQGPFSLSTKAKDVNLRNLKGDVRISDDTGDIELESTSAASLGNLELTTHHGDVHLRLPPKANFQYKVVTRHGDISSNFENVRSQSHTGGSTASGTVGKGGVKINITSDTGDIEISKATGSTEPPESLTPSAPMKPATPGKKSNDDDVL